MRYVDMQQGKTKVYTLKEIMMHWLNNRRTIKRKIFINKFVNGKERLNLLDVLVKICEDKKLCDSIISLIRKSERDAVVELIHKKFDISTTQALGIANMRISGLSKTSLAEYREEYRRLVKDIKEWDDLIHSPKKIDKIIIKELEDAIRKYDKPRRSRVVKYNAAKEENAMISDKDYVIIFTQKGYIKKLPADTKSVGELMAGDEPIYSTYINNRESVVLFDKAGYVHPVNISSIPECSVKSKGLNLSQYVSINGEIIAVIPKNQITDRSHFIFVTKKGFIKKSECKQYALKNSVKGINLKDDELVSAIHGKSNSNVIIYTRNGLGVRIDTSEFVATSRNAAGVIGINLKPGDFVIGMTVVRKNDTHILVMSERGCGKVCSLDALPTSKRRNEPLILSAIGKGDSITSILSCNESSKFIIVTKDNAVPMYFDQFPELTRNHKGKKVVKVGRGDSIIRSIRLN
jgi:DNA gyrase subunit A